MEWTILGDLAALSSALPADLTVATLAGKTTGGIARALRVASQNISEDAVREYIESAANALDDVSKRRNHCSTPGPLPSMANNGFTVGG